MSAHSAENDAGIDYALVLRIVNDSADPAGALRAFIEQEREDAAHKARVTPPVKGAS